MDVLTELVHANRPVSNLAYRQLWRGRSALLPLAISGMLWLTISSARAITVNTTGDGARLPSRDQERPNCDTNPFVAGDQCSLRAAIQTANLSLGQTIYFNIPTTDPGYNAQTGSWTINVSSVLPDLSADMSITGPGADKLVIDGGGNPVGVRVFNVTTAGTVGFSGLTVANGYSSGTEYGVGIRNVAGGTVNITNCTLSGNQCTVASNRYSGGGAIFNASNGIINITNSILRFNRVDTSGGAYVAYGGGIFNNTGTINISNSTFDHNRSTDYGGGIWNEAGKVTVTGSTFHANGAYHGGGIDNRGGTMSIANSTFCANIAYSPGASSSFGGAILNYGVLNLTNSTLTANSADFGGGVYNSTAAGNINVKSSIIALNYGVALDSAYGPDVYGAFTSHGFNFIGKKDGSTGFTKATDKKGTITSPLNPMFDLKGLRDNGGPTQTIGLQTGSPAIDKGTSAGLTGTLSTDQRGSGYPRKFDNTSVANASGGDGTDIGAFERQTP